MKQTEKTRGKGLKPIVVLTPDEGMVIINKDYADWKAQGDGDGGARPPLLLAQEVCLAVTDTADRYAEVSEATAEEYQKEYDEAMMAEQEQEMPMEEMPTEDTTAEEEK